MFLPCGSYHRKSDNIFYRILLVRAKQVYEPL